MLAVNPDGPVNVARAVIENYDKTKTYAFLVGAEAEQETEGGWMSSNPIGTESPSLFFIQDEATTAYCVNLALGGEGVVEDQPSATFSFKSTSTATATVKFQGYNTVSDVPGGWSGVRSYGAKLNGGEAVDSTQDAPLCTAINPIAITDPANQYFTSVLYGSLNNPKLASYKELQYQERTDCMPVPATTTPPQESAPTGGIVGIVVAVIVLLVLLAGMTVFYMKKKAAAQPLEKTDYPALEMSALEMESNKDSHTIEPESNDTIEPEAEALVTKEPEREVSGKEAPAADQGEVLVDVTV